MKRKTTAIFFLALTVLVFSVCRIASAESFAEAAGSTEELFSTRDFSGSYDDEVAMISLDGTEVNTDSEKVTVSGTTITIRGSGTYILTGTLGNGSVVVDAGKEDKVQLVLNGVTIHSDTFAAIYVRQADKVFVTLAENSVNTLTNGGSFQQIDEHTVDAVIYSRDDLTLNGSGVLRINSPAGHGIVGKDDVVITGGSYEIQAKEHGIAAKDNIAIADGSFTINAGQDGLHAENRDDETLGNLYITGGSFTIRSSDDAVHANTILQIDGGSFDISAAEGLEATYIRINDGSISIAASDDDINAAYKSSAKTPTVEINGGEIDIVMAAGDTDGVDSNGNLIINGGTIRVTGNSSFDYDGTATYNGGMIIVNGQQIDGIPNQMMGGYGGMMGNPMGGMMGGMQNGHKGKGNW